MGNANLARQGFVLPVAVEQLALGGATHQRLEFVLAVNVDQDVAGFAELLDGHRLTV